MSKHFVPGRRLACVAVAAWLAGCGALPDKPAVPQQYDFGPGVAGASGAAAAAAPLVLEEVRVAGSFVGSGLMYRLAYANPHQLQPYAYARWSAPLEELLQARLAQHLGREWPVLDAAAAATLARSGGTRPPVLRVQVDEFSHVFAAPQRSQGVVRLRASLLESTPAGERLVAQRTFGVERPAPSADAAGGVQALAQAADAAGEALVDWVRSLR